MEPDGIDIGQVYATVGQVVGTPAAILLFWVVSKLRELQTKIKILEKENSVVKQTLIYALTYLFIRGRLEEK